MREVYETTGNVHFPELKCQLPKGTRMIVEDGKMTVNERTVDITENFQIMVRYNLVRKLTEEEEQQPEQIEAPKVIAREERKKMRVEQEEDNIVPITRRFSNEKDEGEGVVVHKEDDELKKEIESENSLGTVRGMKVIQEDSTPIAVVKSLPKDSSKDVTTKKPPVRPTPKSQKSEKTEDQKKAEAAALKAKRLQKAAAASSNVPSKKN